MNPLSCEGETEVILPPTTCGRHVSNSLQDWHSRLPASVAVTHTHRRYESDDDFLARVTHLRLQNKGISSLGNTNAFKSCPALKVGVRAQSPSREDCMRASVSSFTLSTVVE